MDQPADTTPVSAAIAAAQTVTPAMPDSMMLALGSIPDLDRPTSAYRGVQWHARGQKWRACIKHEGKKIFLGSFGDEEEAARAFDRGALRLRGVDTPINFELADYQDLVDQIESGAIVPSGAARSRGRPPSDKPPRVGKPHPKKEAGTMLLSSGVDYVVPEVDRPHPALERLRATMGEVMTRPLSEFIQEVGDKMEVAKTAKALEWVRAGRIIKSEDIKVEDAAVAAAAAAAAELDALPLFGLAPDGQAPHLLGTGDGAALPEELTSPPETKKRKRPINTPDGLPKKYKGVSWTKEKLKWRAQIGLPDGQKRHIGYYATEEEGARAFDRAVLELVGIGARTNFPLSEYLTPEQLAMVQAQAQEQAGTAAAEPKKRGRPRIYPVLSAAGSGAMDSDGEANGVATNAAVAGDGAGGGNGTNDPKGQQPQQPALGSAPQEGAPPPPAPAGVVVSPPCSNYKSGHRYVQWLARDQTWQAKGPTRGSRRLTSLGNFCTEKDAVSARDEYIKSTFGEDELERLRAADYAAATAATAATLVQQQMRMQMQTQQQQQILAAARGAVDAAAAGRSPQLAAPLRAAAAAAAAGKKPAAGATAVVNAPLSVGLPDAALALQFNQPLALAQRMAHLSSLSYLLPQASKALPALPALTGEFYALPQVLPASLAQYAAAMPTVAAPQLPPGSAGYQTAWNLFGLQTP